MHGFGLCGVRGSRSPFLGELPDTKEILTIVSILRPKIAQCKEIPEKPIFLDIMGLVIIFKRCRYSHHSFNLYSGGYPMKKHLKMYMPCS